MHFDYSARTVRVADKTIKRLRGWKKSLFQSTWGQWMTGFGRLLYASRILRFPLSGVYEVIKFHRRQCAKYARDELAETDDAAIWNCVKPALVSWLDHVLNNEKVSVRKSPTPNDRWVLATDASTKGWGGVLFDSSTGEIKDFGQQWDRDYRSHDINELEAEAVLRALKEFDLTPEKIDEHGLLIMVDNTSVMHTMHKGRAHEWPLNHKIHKV
eukprot:gene4024-14504_t